MFRAPATCMSRPSLIVTRAVVVIDAGRRLIGPGPRVLAGCEPHRRDREALGSGRDQERHTHSPIIDVGLLADHLVL